jgi:hypothetical protein
MNTYSTTCPAFTWILFTSCKDRVEIEVRPFYTKHFQLFKVPVAIEIMFKSVKITERRLTCALLSVQLLVVLVKKNGVVWLLIASSNNVMLIVVRSSAGYRWKVPGSVTQQKTCSASRPAGFPRLPQGALYTRSNDDGMDVLKLFFSDHLISFGPKRNEVRGLCWKLRSE